MTILHHVQSAKKRTHAEQRRPLLPRGDLAANPIKQSKRLPSNPLACLGDLTLPGTTLLRQVTTSGHNTSDIQSQTLQATLRGPHAPHMHPKYQVLQQRCWINLHR